MVRKPVLINKPKPRPTPKVRNLVFRATAASMLLAVLLPASVAAQGTAFDRLTPAFPTQGERKAADIASYVTLGAAFALDFKASWDAPDRSHALQMQAARTFGTWAFSSVVKGLVLRHRPCAPDCGVDSPDSSFYSMHTAFAFSTLGGPRLAVALPLSVGTGGLRVAAGKHWLSDTIIGAAAGWAASRIR